MPESGLLASAYSSSAEKGELIVQNVLPKLVQIAQAYLTSDIFLLLKQPTEEARIPALLPFSRKRMA